MSPRCQQNNEENERRQGCRLWEWELWKWELWEFMGVERSFRGSVLGVGV